MVRDVVMRAVRRSESGTFRAAGWRSVGVLAHRRETAGKPTPGYVLLVPQIPNLQAGTGDARRFGRAHIGRGQAIVKARPGVADQRAKALRACDVSAGIARSYAVGRKRQQRGAAGVSTDEINGSHAGGSEVRAIGIVAHRVVLRIIPQGGHGVPIVVANDDARAFTIIETEVGVCRRNRLPIRTNSIS